MLDLITDRTEADAAEVERLISELNDGKPVYNELRIAVERGCYTKKRVLKVVKAMNQVVDMLRYFGYSITLEPISSQGDYMTQADAEAYLRNAKKLKNIIQTDAPEPPATLDNLTPEAANAIEKVLAAIDEYTDIVLSTWIPCGRPGLYCGSNLYFGGAFA